MCEMDLLYRYLMMHFPISHLALKGFRARFCFNIMLSIYSPQLFAHSIIGYCAFLLQTHIFLAKRYLVMLIFFDIFFCDEFSSIFYNLIDRSLHFFTEPIPIFSLHSKQEQVVYQEAQ